jgi:Holliday junction DNA helicase RuvB
MSEAAQDISQGSPPTLDHVIGQKRAIQQLKTAIEANINDRAATGGGEAPALPHILMVGPPGVGKSMLSQIVAREVGSRLHEELAQNVLSPAHLQGLMMLADPYDVVFMDEIHELATVAQTTLYRCLEERRLFLPSGSKGQTHSIVLPPFTFIGATTDEWRLAAPLRHRFKIVIRLQQYSEIELGQLLAQRARRLGWQVEEAATHELAVKGRGTPRVAIRLMDATRRVARAEGADAISARHVARMREIEGVDCLGLDVVEQKYLQILAGSSSPVRLNVLSTMLALPRRTVESVIESELLRLGLVSKEEQGRILTSKGREHLAGTTASTT